MIHLCLQPYLITSLLAQVNINLVMLYTRIASFLLDIEAVKINVKEPFTWTSGIKSPVYCDCRIVNSKVAARDAVTAGFTEIINKDFPSNTDIIAGVASGGISHGVLIADRLKKPFIYVREERKKYGLKKQIEGDFSVGNTVILIEDLISTGGSSIKAVEVLKNEGLKLICLLSIMTYGFKQAEDNFSEANVVYKSLCNVNAILQVASEKGIINSDDTDKILQFIQSPKEWKP